VALEVHSIEFEEASPYEALEEDRPLASYGYVVVEDLEFAEAVGVLLILMACRRTDSRHISCHRIPLNIIKQCLSAFEMNCSYLCLDLYYVCILIDMTHEWRIKIISTNSLITS